LHVGTEVKVFFAPALGFATLIILSGTISTLCNVSTPNAIIFSSILLLIYLIKLEVRQRLFFQKKMLKHILSVSVLGAAVSGFFNLSKSKFGSANFDFLWNLNDSFYLQHHLMTEYFNGNRQSQLPLNWSANPAGRYGASYIFALLDRFAFHPLQWSFSVYCVLVSLVWYAFYGTLSLTLNKKKIECFIYSIIAFFSSLNVMAVSYEVVGQISGIPLMLLIIYLSYQLYANERFIENIGSLILILILGLTWIYPAQVFVVAPVFAFAVLSKIFKLNRSVKPHKFFVIFLSISIFIIFWNYHYFFTRFSQIISVSTSSTSSNGSSGGVFNQFSSIFGPAISFGLLPYPFRGHPVEGVFACISLVVLLALVFWSFYLSYVKHKSIQKVLDFHFFHQIYVLGLFAVCYFVLRSNYTLFKITTWFTPLFIAYAFYGLRKSLNLVRQNMRFLACILLIPSIAFISVASGATIASAWKGHTRNFTHTLDHGHSELVRYLSSVPVSNVYFVLPSMEDAAWTSMDLPSPQLAQVHILGSGHQVLDMGQSQRCFTGDPVMKKSLIVTDTEVRDVVDGPIFIGKPKAIFGSYSIYSSDQLVQAVAMMGGVFYTEPAPFGLKIKDSLIRWSGGNFCIGIWESTPRNVRIKISLQPGPDLLQAPELKLFDRSFRANSIKDKFEFESSIQPLHKGWNYIQVENQADKRIISPHTSRPDFRQLAYAVKSVSAVP
jgi:hypothetical protein